VLVNTAIAIADDPVRMAAAFRKGVEAGREAFLAGIPQEMGRASATSPLEGFLQALDENSPQAESTSPLRK
jgi:thiazole synthase